MTVSGTMKRRSKTLGLIGVLSVALLFATATVWSAASTAQAQTPVMKVVPADQTVDISDGNFSVDIVIEGVSRSRRLRVQAGNRSGSRPFGGSPEGTVLGQHRTAGTVSSANLLSARDRHARGHSPLWLRHDWHRHPRPQRLRHAGNRDTGSQKSRHQHPQSDRFGRVQTGTTNTIGDRIDVTSSGGQVTVVGIGPGADSGAGRADTNTNVAGGGTA